MENKQVVLYNVMTRKKEVFKPIEEGKIRLYACGITVSGDAHIGHAYQAVVFDTIKKYFEFCGYEVTYVRNYTDVDDKIIAKANELKVDPMDYANKQIVKIDSELKALSIDRPTHQVRATENIQDMINFISKLIEKGYAYPTEYGDVFYSVKMFKDYGKLSHREVEDSLSGVRKDVEPGKRDDQDFALWKSAKPGEIFWESPWGKGRPGWHIECSTMSMKYLGETIDIHGGGKDLIFPHHENEIAQSEALTGKEFSNYWMHNGLVKINGQKMSKSMGNGISIEKLLSLYHPDVIRFVLLQNNYRSDLNVVSGIFEEVEKHVYGFYKTFKDVDAMEDNGKEPSENFKDVEKEFNDAMSNDFNTAVALANIFKYFDKLRTFVRKHKTADARALKNEIIKLYNILGILQKDPQEVIDVIRNKYIKKYDIDEAKVEELLKQRSEFKKNKDYSSADAIKSQLTDMGILIFDGAEGTKWDIEIKSDIK